MLNITLIQSALIWQNREVNLKHFSALIQGILEPTDLIILPEMFTTGFSMFPEQHAETMDGPAIQWMKDMASAKQCAITGSMMLLENGRFYNRLVFMFPDGHFEYYDKRHLFRMADEHNHYVSGKNRILLELKGFRIFPVICYDLRFPVWLRRSESFDYDLMVVVANWPERRNVHWKILSQARAIENQCVVAAVNRIGEDGNQINHSGDSALFTARGEIVIQEAHTPFVKTFQLNKKDITDYREQFQVIKDADSFTLQ